MGMLPLGIFCCRQAFITMATVEQKLYSEEGRFLRFGVSWRTKCRRQ